jgi:hypothetical protein
MLAYFASDGNFGDATDLVLIDVSNFTSEDWEELDMVPDNERQERAIELAKSYNQNSETTHYIGNF